MQEKSAPFLSPTTTELAQDQEERDELITYGKRDAAGKLFKISHNRLPLFESADAIFPGNTAPIIRNASSGERELVNQSWGFVLVMDSKAPRCVTNVRDDKIRSSYFLAWLIRGAPLPGTRKFIF